MPLSLTNILSNHNPSKAYTQPAFAIWSNPSSGPGGFSTYDHNYNCIGRSTMTNTGSYGGTAAMNSTGAPEMFDNWANTQILGLTNGTASTTNYMQKGANSCGYLGNIVFTMGEGFAGDMSGSTGAAGYRAPAFRDCGTIVNEIDQNYAIWIRYITTNTLQFVVGPRSAQWYHNQTINRDDARNLTITTKNSGYGNTMYGNMSYNVKTAKLCILECDGAFRFKPTVYSGVPVLKQYAENQYYGMTEQSAARSVKTGSSLYTFFATGANYATNYVFWTGKPANGSTEDNTRCIPIMCDNGKIVAHQMISSGGNYFWAHRWNADGTAEGSLYSGTYTTSYGVDQGAAYGARFCVSSDGRYVLAYNAAYYYSSGVQMMLTRVSDGKTIYDFNNDSSYAYMFTPMGKSDFACFRDVNADGGAGVYHQHITSDWLMWTSADKARVNMCRLNMIQMLSSNYNSTDYPTIIPIIYDTKIFNNL